MAVDKRLKRAILDAISRREAMSPEEQEQNDARTEVLFHRFCKRMVGIPLFGKQPLTQYMN